MCSLLYLNIYFNYLNFKFCSGTFFLSVNTPIRNQSGDKSIHPSFNAHFLQSDTHRPIKIIFTLLFFSSPLFHSVNQASGSQTSNLDAPVLRRHPIDFTDKAKRDSERLIKIINIQDAQGTDREQVFDQKKRYSVSKNPTK